MSYALFAVNAKSDEDAWDILEDYFEVHKYVCTICNIHIFVCFYDLSVGDNSPRDIGDNIIFLQDDINPNTKIYTTKD